MTQNKQSFETYIHTVSLFVLGLITLAILLIPITHATSENSNTLYISSSKMQYNMSEPVNLILTNVGTSPYTIYSNTTVLIINSDNNQDVYHGTLNCNAGKLCTQVYWKRNLSTGQTYTWTWNQKDNNNAQLPSGSYYSVIDDYSSNSFSILSIDTNTTPTPTPTPTLNATPTPTPTLNITPTPTPTLNVTPTPTQCTSQNVNMGTKSTYVGDSTDFGLDFSSTKLAWNVSWYVNNTVVKNESNVTSISSISSIGQLRTTNVTAYTINNNCKVVNYTWLWIVTQRPPQSNSGGGSSGGSSSSGSSSSGSSGGGGGGVSSSEPYNNIGRYITKENNILLGKPVAYLFAEQNFSIYEIDVIGNTSDTDVSVRLEHLKNITLTAEKYPAGVIYANENIWINSRRVESVRIKFRVLNSWIESNNFNKEDIKLLKYYATNWWELNTNITKNDSKYVYYEALSSGQSPYAISKLGKDFRMIKNSNSSSINKTFSEFTNTLETNNSSNTSTNSSLPNTSNDVGNLPLIGLVTLIGISSIAVFALRTVKRKLESKK